MAYYPNDMLTPHFLTGAIEERPTRESIKQRYLWPEFLPLKEVPERRLTWDAVAAENNLAGFYGTKGEPVPGDDLIFKSHFANLIDVMATRHLDHDILNSVRAPGMLAVYKTGGSAAPIQGLRARFEDHMRGLINWCDDTVEAQMEYMAINALQGTLVWPPTTAVGGAISPPMPHWNANMTLSFTFPLNANFIQNASTLSGHNARAGGAFAWNNANADPIKDMEVIAEYMVEQKGINADDMLLILSRTTLSRIAYLSSILNWLNSVRYNTPLGTAVDLKALQEFISSRLGWTIRTYDAQWTYRTNIGTVNETVQRVKFLKEGKVIIIPKAEVNSLGNMMTTFHKDGSGQFKSGKYSWMHEDDEPPFGTRLGEGIVSWPVLPMADSQIFVMDSYA